MSNLDDFDQPPRDFEAEEPQQRRRSGGLGQNIKNAWGASPVFKIFLLLVGGGAIASAALGVFNSDSKNKTAESVVQTTGSTTATPGGEAPPAYQEAVNSASAERARAAASQGGSAFPTPMGNTTQMTALDPSQQNNDDPLAEFRRQQEQENEQKLAPADNPAPQANNRTNPNAIQSNNVPPNSEPALDQNLAQAMQQQMQTLMNGWNPQNARVIKVAQGADQVGQGGANGNSGANTPPPFNPGKTLVQAGTINYGQMLLEANSDVPGPIMAQILSGPFSGARAVGNFQTMREHLVIRFNLINYKGKDYSVDILALDPDTTLGGLATETDHRYWERVIFPAAAEFVSGFAQGFTQQDQNVVIADGVVISERASGSLRRGLGQGADEAGQRVSNIINQQAAQIRPLVKVHAGTPIGLFFTRTITENTPTPEQAQNLPGYQQGQQGAGSAGAIPGLVNQNAIYPQTGGGYGMTGYESGYNPYNAQNTYNMQAYGNQNGAYGANNSMGNAYAPLNRGSSSTNYGNGITVVPANGVGATIINPR